MNHQPSTPGSAPELFQVIMASIGYVEGNLIHAYSAAFHRVPRLFKNLDPQAFLSSSEIHEVTAVLIRLLETRTALHPGQAKQEEMLRESLDAYRRAWGD